ncbi:hypothetical protein RF11_03577 [Thelohanellus kitauei]|uniref:Exocyst complex subunit Exo70 C-terminal domain-containing protein n=1 Tax=Thelohanellus kitauei TaxID=669202 RepID=A0A0C2JQH9_THEKT|nr:hypothetical protein RF11_03577 [Thelohanellus kitauei]
MINVIESIIIDYQNNYMDNWINPFLILCQQKPTLSSVSQDTMINGKQLGKTKRDMIKNQFKVINSHLEQMIKTHENVVVYHQRISDTINSMLRQKFLPLYEEIHNFFMEIPFTRDPKKHIRISVDDISRAIDHLM